jgi:sulfate-transporting ATPase
MSAISRSLVITSFAGSVVVITHDCWFLDRLATHITAFESDGYVHVCEGNLGGVGGAA